MSLLEGVAIVLIASGIQTTSAVPCNCTGFDDCSWTAWSTEFAGRAAVSDKCSTGVPVWRGCFCNNTSWNVTKCEPYTCGSWGSWGTWSANCGTRSRNRSRSCKTSSNATYSDGNVTRSSESQPVWLPWSSWSNWSAPCGVPGRSRNRTRICFENRCPLDHDDLSTCFGLSLDTETEPLPSWSSWSWWGQWTATCDSRVRLRLRNCSAGTCGMVNNCSGPSNQTIMDPNPPCCPVNASWAPWGRWSDWSATCGTRMHSRYRNCTVALCGGLPSCSGTSTDKQGDTSPDCCPVDAVWSTWRDWGSWSATCGNRSRQRTRQCVNGSCGGNTVCSGISLDTLPDSNYPSCPVTDLTSTPATTSHSDHTRDAITEKSKSETGLKTWLIVVVAASSGLALLTVILVTVCFCTRKRRRRGTISVDRPRSRVERSHSFFMDMMGGSFYKNPLARTKSSDHKSGEASNSLPEFPPAGTELADQNGSEKTKPQFANLAYRQSDEDNPFCQ